MEIVKESKKQMSDRKRGELRRKERQTDSTSGIEKYRYGERMRHKDRNGGRKNRQTTKMDRERTLNLRK